MVIKYSKLWKLLIDKNMKKTELIKLSGISSNAMANMVKRKMFLTMYYVKYVMSSIAMWKILSK